MTIRSGQDRSHALAQTLGILGVALFLTTAAAPRGLAAMETASLGADALAAELIAHDAIPAAGVAVLQCGALDTATEGRLRVDELVPATGTARFNIGSNAKSMAATLAATLVKADVIGWDTTIAGSGVFPAVPTEHPLASSTLEDLFRHASGIATFHTGSALGTVETEGTPTEQRRQFAEQALAAEPVGPRGEAAYSNAGLVVASVMLETLANQDFFDVMAERVFTPLDITATLGDPAGEAQPFGHYVNSSGSLVAYTGTDPVIPPFLQPAGDISLTAEDYGRYLNVHLCGLRGRDTAILSADEIKTLHSVPDSLPYALGWAQTDLGGEQTSFHIGGTGAFYAVAAVLPEANLAYGIMVNSGSPAALAHARDVLRDSIEDRADQGGSN